MLAGTKPDDEIATMTVCVCIPPYHTPAEAAAAAAADTADGFLARVQSFRKLYDRAVTRWPPHLTVLAPATLPVDAISPSELHALLQPIVAGVAASAASPAPHASYTLVLDRVGVFTHPGSSTVVLEPRADDPATRLLAAIQPQLEAAVAARLAARSPATPQGAPDADDGHAHGGGRAYRPHLTLGNPVRGGKRVVDPIVAAVERAFFGGGGAAGGAGGGRAEFAMDRLCIMVKGHGKGSFYRRVPELDLMFALGDD
ncbi:2'-5' RNA ligase superfamily-domain-containing protein [Zopfochytrium polystomum]|nr:2'-5' RNA ligase superfamily-domain-containing protein [Zopfochytrium polystomum]